MKIYEILFAYSILSFVVSVPVTAYFIRWFLRSSELGWQIAQFKVATYLLRSDRLYSLIPLFKVLARLHYVVWGIMFATLADVFLQTKTLAVPNGHDLETFFGVLQGNDQNLFFLCFVFMTYGVTAFATIMGVLDMIASTKIKMQKC